MFGVGCSMLDVPLVHGEGRGEGGRFMVREQFQKEQNTSDEPAREGACPTETQTAPLSVISA
ncbi:MAG: hypothetical protein DME22_13085 [Verrucomicrobia bacterium]|nr:MAG: hypothetical protein DME22_13085 [Verrucomicrobiota bacterium]PYJ92545.1 MAG: hypothetical protein DME23_27230 [Verrucomicrobiota bacterium]